MPKIMYGPGISGEQVTEIQYLNNGKIVHTIYDNNDNNTKMISSDGQEKYYKGNIQQFNPNIWNSYTSAGKGKYSLKDILPKIMYGPWILGEQETQVKSLNNGKIVYIMNDGNYTKMVTSDGKEEKYYKGSIEQFNPYDWDGYTTTGGGKFSLKNIRNLDSYGCTKCSNGVFSCTNLPISKPVKNGVVVPENTEGVISNYKVDLYDVNNPSYTIDSKNYWWRDGGKCPR